MRALLARGRAVRVLDDFSTGRLENLAGVRADVNLVTGDVRDAAAVGDAMRGVDEVLHQAAVTSVALSFEQPGRVDSVNVGGTVTVLVAARAAGVRRILLASSCAVYGDPERLPLDETVVPAPLSPYAVGKLAAEGYLRALGPQTVALRYFNVFGPRQDPDSEYSGVIARFMRCARAGLPCVVYGDGRQTRDFVYVADVVAANLLALESAAAVGQVVNVGSGVETSLLQLIDGIGAVAGTSLHTQHSPERAGDLRRSCADLANARELLGYQPGTPLRAGLEATFAWFGEDAGPEG